MTFDQSAADTLVSPAKNLEQLALSLEQRAEAKWQEFQTLEARQDILLKERAALVDKAQEYRRAIKAVEDMAARDMSQAHDAQWSADEIEACRDQTAADTPRPAISASPADPLERERARNRLSAAIVERLAAEKGGEAEAAPAAEAQIVPAWSIGRPTKIEFGAPLDNTFRVHWIDGSSRSYRMTTKLLYATPIQRSHWELHTKWPWFPGTALVWPDIDEAVCLEGEAA